MSDGSSSWSRALRLGLALVLCASVAPTIAFGRAEKGVLDARESSRSRLTKLGDPAQGRGWSDVRGASAADAEYVPGEVLVKFKGTVSAAAKSNSHAKLGVKNARPVRGVAGLDKVRVTGKLSVEDAVEAYEKLPEVAYAQPNYLYSAASIPNDPRFDELWGLNNEGQTGGVEDADIDAPEAWDIETGSSDVIVAVIDTGVDYTHPDLADNMWINEGEIPGNGIDDDGNGYVDDVYGYDFVNYDGDPMDDHAHGTHCSGTIGAVGDNGIGVAGVAWDVRIMALKFLSADGWGTTEGAVEAIAYADMMGARVMSNSWGGGWYDQLLYDAIEAIDGTFIAAAGNEMSNTDFMPFYPAAYDLENIVSVGATDQYDQVAFFSNFGQNSVDVFAPGDEILSTVPGRQPRFIPEVVSVVFSDDMTTLDDWDVSQYNTEPWELSTDEFVSEPSSVAHLGYQDMESAWLKLTAPVDLSGVQSAAVRAQMFYDIEEDWDYVFCYASTDGVDWQQVGSVTGSSAGFTEEFFDITGLAGENEVYVAFELQSDEIIDSDQGFMGAFVDDIEIVETDTRFYEAFDDLDDWDVSQYAVSPWSSFTDEYGMAPPSAANVPYANNEDAWLTLTTLVDLSDITDEQVALSFRSLYAIEPGFDFFRVWASTDGMDWQQLTSFTSWSSYPAEQITVPLDDFAGESEVFVAFSIDSDGSIAGEEFWGAMVDDVSISVGTWTEADYDTAYDVFSGTSMATPHVSGLAALILSQKPELTADLVKWSIMDTVDVLPSLRRKAVTEGRINAHSAMLDHWPPFLSIDIQDEYNASATINISATDDTGVEEIRYRFDSGRWTSVADEEAQAVFAVPGVHTITYYASDVLGNVSMPQTASFRIARGPVSYVSVAGSNRYATAVEASKRGFPEGADAIVLATGENWPDALGGTALAGAAEGPVLLTPGTALPANVAAEITRLGASKAYVLGGSGAVSDGVLSALEPLVGGATNIVRISGGDRYDTARKIADRVILLQGDQYDGKAFVATGANFPDALAASPIAAAKGWPILLAQPSGAISLPDKVTSAVILGGPGAVKSGVEAALEGALGETNVVRRGGPNRYGTAALVAAYGVNRGMYWEGIGVATGDNFPDALSGGAMLGRRNTVLLLTPPNALDDDARAPLMLNKHLLQTIDFLGGTNAVSNSVRNEVKLAVE